MALKRIWIFWLCLWLGVSAALIPNFPASAQTATPTPALKVCWGDSQGRTSEEKVVLVASNITLVYFCVEYYQADDMVLVSWETASELDTSGYFVWRSEVEAGPYEVWSPFIQAEGGLVSMRYEWIEDEITRGKVYYYKLEEIDTNNATTGLFGPVRFDFYSSTATPTATYAPGVTPTKTLTPTLGPTPTSTNSPTAGPTPTRTFTPIPTSTSDVPVSTSTPTLSPTPTPALDETQRAINGLNPSEVFTPTATLEPLPPIMLLFPAATATPAPTVIAQVPPAELVDGQTISITPPQANLTWRIWLLGGIVLLLWIVLSAALVLYLQQAQAQVQD
jgi:hypothetical protein